jgi:hypothetical protein
MPQINSKACPRTQIFASSAYLAHLTPRCASNEYDPRRFHPLDDMVMKMQALELPFVDVPHAKFYALLVSYCVWDPSAVAPLQDLIPSILPELSRG